MASGAYALALLVSIPLMHRLGLVGFLIPWAISEVLQLFYLLHLNAALFRQATLTMPAPTPSERVDLVDRRPVYVLLAVLAVGTLVLAWPVFHLEEFRMPVQLAFALVTTLVMLAVSYWLFRVDEVRAMLWERIAGRFPAFAARRG